MPNPADIRPIEESQATAAPGQVGPDDLGRPHPGYSGHPEAYVGGFDGPNPEAYSGPFGGTRLEKILNLIRQGGICAIFMPEEKALDEHSSTFIVNVFDGRDHNIQRFGRVSYINEYLTAREASFARVLAITSIGQQVAEHIYDNR